VTSYSVTKPRKPAPRLTTIIIPNDTKDLDLTSVPNINTRCFSRID
jgi:hypothetical protein